MRSRELGRSGVAISRIGLGGIEVGPNPGEEPDVDRAIAVLEVSLEAGVNWIDTSENYLETRNESLIGEALGTISGELLVATKVAPGAAGSAHAIKSVRARLDSARQKPALIFMIIVQIIL